MRDYGSVQTCFWSNTDIQHLSDQAKLLALYLLTGPHTNMLGCFRMPIGYIAEDLSWSSETVVKRFKELSQISFAVRDEISQWVLIPKFLQWNAIENPNQGKSIQRLFEQVPKNSCIFKPLIEVLLLYQKHLDTNFIHSLQTLLKPFLNQEQDQEQDQKQDHKQEQESYSLEIRTKKSDQISNPITIINIPLLNKTEFPIFQAQIDEWQILYPGIDILQTLRNIRGWNLANTKQRKTSSGILRHITNWLAKEQNRSNKTSILNSTQSASLHAHNNEIGQHWIDMSNKQENVGN